MSDGNSEVHTAITDHLLDDGELAVGWMLVVDVVGSDDARYLAYHAGGGVDGEDPPMIWVAVGMLEAGLLATQHQMTMLEDEDDLV